MTGAVRVYGAGPSGLMAAETLQAAGVPAVVIDRMPSAARKFLMAGRGGLNLTHAEPLDDFLGRYGAARARLEPAIRAFTPEDLRRWADGLAAETFVGSSGRVFPKAMKASPLLRAWLTRLGAQGVAFKLRESWPGFDGAPAILALGGASWPRLGADGSWVSAFAAAGIAVTPFGPSNSGVCVAWSAYLKDKFAGAALKRVAMAYDGVTARGEAVITPRGLEGGVVYALSARVRERPGLPLVIDFAPDRSAAEVDARLAQTRPKDSRSNRLRKALGLSSAAIAVLREGTGGVKSLHLRADGVDGLARAISSSGGVAWSEIGDGFMLKKQPGVFVCGEMLDWEAPTGGYLLQACFATGRAAAAGLLAARAPQS